MSDKIETVAYWMGKRVTELSKEELIEALNWCGKEIERLYKQAQHDRDFLMGIFLPENKNEP